MLTIRGWGTAVPEHVMSQAEATALAQEVICRDEQQSRLVAALYRKAGVDARRTVLPHRLALDWMPGGIGALDLPPGADVYGPTTGERMRYFAEHAPPLAATAASRALADAGVEANAITHLVTVSCTGFAAPGVDIALISRLGLPSSTQRVQVGFMGCHGAINGLRVALALAQSDPRACVLLCAVELCSLHYRFRWDPERIVANALFADGAAALVADGRSPAAAGGWSVAATGSCLVPDTQDAMTWNIGDHGFEMTLDARVPDLIRRHVRPWLSAWLADRGQDLESIRSWAIHPGGPRILAAVEEALGLARESTAVSREVLARHGNMSSPTVLFIVERLRRSQAPRPCVALGFGPGLIAEAALWQ
jgi:predicted naringenin-chalcone synthase